MDKTTLYLDSDDYRKLKRIAERRRLTAASLVREAVAEYVTRHGAAGLPRSIGAGDSGLGDLGERAEDYLAGMGESARPRRRRDRR